MVPWYNAETLPDASTVATTGLLEDQVPPEGVPDKVVPEPIHAFVVPPIESDCAFKLVAPNTHNSNKTAVVKILFFIFSI